MIEFRINGQPLHLFPGTAAELEERHPIVNEDLADAFTLPLEIPVERNQAALGHVHELRITGRKIRIDGVELWNRGRYMRRGVFFVEGSTEGIDGVVSVSFSVDGFISGMAGDKLRAVDYGPNIEFFSVYAMRADAVAKNSQVWPEARYCYPTIFNPDAYGGNNKDWVPDARAYDPDASYSAGQFVLYTRDEPVRRERMFVCLGGGASPGQDPDNTPSVWAPYGYGLINRWNSAAGEFWWNGGAVGNWAAMSPQFYLKDVLQRAMKHKGLTAIGDFFDDPRTHSITVYNNQLLDAGDRNDYVLATQTVPVTYVANDPNTDPGQLHWANGFDFALVADDETTPPNSDAANRWDGTDDYQVTTAGEHRFRARVKCSSATAIYLQISVVNPATNAILITGYAGSMADRRTNWDTTFNAARVFTAGETGQNYRIIVTPRLWGTDNSGAVGSISFTLSECYVEIWRGSSETLNTYAPFIVPKDHVPNITVEHLLLDLRDWLHLRITPLPEEGTVRFDYQEDILYRAVTTDITPYVRGRIALDHASRTTGIRLKSPTGRVEDLPDLSGHFDDGDFDSEASLPTPASDLHKAYVRNTGQLVVSRLFNTNQYAWFVLGTLCRDAEVGDMTNAREVAPEFGPPPMDLVASSDHSICLMPVIKEKCSSGMFGVGNNDPGLYLMYYKGMQPNGVGGLYPLATGFARNQDGAVLGLPRTPGGPPVFAMALLFDPSDSYAHYANLWRRWAEVLAKAEVYVTDIDTSKLYARGRGIPIERFLLHNQVVLIDTLPTRYDDTPGPPIAEEVRILRLPHA